MLILTGFAIAIGAYFLEERKYIPKSLAGFLGLGSVCLISVGIANSLSSSELEKINKQLSKISTDIRRTQSTCGSSWSPSHPAQISL